MTLLIRVVKDLRKNSIYIEGLKFKLQVHAMRINWRNRLNLLLPKK